MPAKVELVRATPAHVGRIAARMRAIDRLETEAFGHTPKQALRLGLMGSTIAYTAKVDGKVEAMFGMSPRCLLSGEGTPWFLGTDEVYRHGRELVAWGPVIIGQMLEQCPMLENWVAVANRKAIRLLGLWGFTVGEESRVFGGVEFVPFTLAATRLAQVFQRAA